MSRGHGELFDCTRVGDYLESYLLDQVPPPERRGMRLHIHGCPDCFEKVTARDPLQLFAPLGDQTRPGDAWDDFWPAVRDEMGERARSVWTPGRLALAAAAVVLLIGAAIVAPRLVVRNGQPETTIAMAREGTVAAPVAGVASPVGSPIPQTVEQVRTPDSRDVQIYSMYYYEDDTSTTAAESRVTELVLIVDEGLEL